MGKGFIITATNTERGKTFVTAGIVCWLRAQGIDAIPMKPVQTGINPTDNFLDDGSDLSYICNLSGYVLNEDEHALMQPYVYQSPCSPHLAAERDDQPYPLMDQIVSSAEELMKRHDVVLIEGAGGLFVPMDRVNKVFLVDVFERLALPAIVVSRNGLGAIHDTVAALEALKQRNIPIVGFLFSNNDNKEQSYIQKDNPKIISEMTGVSYLGTLRYIQDITKENLCKAVSEDLPILKEVFGISKQGVGHEV